MLSWLWIRYILYLHVTEYLIQISLNQRETLLAHLYEKPRVIQRKALDYTMAQMGLPLHFSAAPGPAFLHVNLILGFIEWQNDCPQLLD